MKRLIKKYRSLCCDYYELEKSFGEKEIHDKRVCLRKIFSVLGLYKIKPNKIKHCKVIFKKSGQLRDTQVQIIKLETLDEGKYLSEYVDHLKSYKIKCHKKYKKSCKKKHILFPKIAKRKVDILKIKKKAYQRLRKIINKTALLNSQNSNSLLHKIRIEVKKYRYTLELLYFLDKKDNTNIEELKRIQDLLGDIQDIDVLIQGISKFYAKKHIDKSKIINMLEENKLNKINQFIEEKNIFIDVCKEAMNANHFNYQI